MIGRFTALKGYVYYVSSLFDHGISSSTRSEAKAMLAPAGPCVADGDTTFPQELFQRLVFDGHLLSRGGYFFLYEF